MEEVKLKKKITLRRKQEEADFTFGGKLKVNLYWTSDTDLDLCLFSARKTVKQAVYSPMNTVRKRATSEPSTSSLSCSI